jgi:hypothetical protein
MESLVNTAYLDHLYDTALVNNITIGFVHIYAEAPDYEWVDAKGEGIACIDDAARAAVFYMNYYKSSHDIKCLDKIRNLINFHLYMQSSSGFFYNFIWKDFSIDTSYRTSVAEPNWWSWRALWALSEAHKFYMKSDPAFSNKINIQAKKLIDTLLNWLNKENKQVTYGGYKLPAWLPFESAADQSAIIVKALSSYYENDKSERIKTTIEHLCSGIIEMQKGDKRNPPYYAFLSWQNTWHAWGNSQSDALFDAGRVLNKKEYFEAAVNEIKYFYPWLLRNGLYVGFTVNHIEKGIPLFQDTTKFTQIAYDVRPMIFSCMNAYDNLKDSMFLNNAINIVKWFFKNNPADALMYNPETGRGYDGIFGFGKINYNAGAESTIESLLSMQRIENNINGKKLLMDIYKKI